MICELWGGELGFESRFTEGSINRSLKAPGNNWSDINVPEILVLYRSAHFREWVYVGLFPSTRKGCFRDDRFHIAVTAGASRWALSFHIEYGIPSGPAAVLFILDKANMTWYLSSTGVVTVSVSIATGEDSTYSLSWHRFIKKSFKPSINSAWRTSCGLCFLKETLSTLRHQCWDPRKPALPQFLRFSAMRTDTLSVNSLTLLALPEAAALLRFFSKYFNNGEIHGGSLVDKVTDLTAKHESMMLWRVSFSWFVAQSISSELNTRDQSQDWILFVNSSLQCSL